MAVGQIFKIHSDFYYVSSNNSTFECKLRHVLKKQKQKVFVGDYVEFENGAIEKILPRKNFITRPTVANIDQVIIISAVKEPELNFLQLNRYISFAKYHNLNTVLCFNKNDLSNDDSTIEKVFKIYEPLGFDILFTSALEGYGIEDFKKILENKTSVLCGASGVGKSSIINSIFEDKINGYIAKKRMVTGLDKAKTTFKEEKYISETKIGKTEFYYENIKELAETEDYFVFVFDQSHAQIYAKKGIASGNIDDFRKFIIEKTEKKIQEIK